MIKRLPASPALILAALAISFFAFNGGKKSPGTDKYICFEVLSDPPGATVYKSHPSQTVKTYIGITPVKLQCFTTRQIADSSSTIHVLKPGYEDWKMEMELRGYYDDSLSVAQAKPLVIQATLKKIVPKQ